MQSSEKCRVYRTKHHASRGMQTDTRQRDWYAVLGVTHTSTQKQIKTAYYDMSKKYHPDLNSGKQSELASSKMADLSEAYKVLGNIDSRKVYDRERLWRKGSTSKRITEPYSKQEVRLYQASGGYQSAIKYDEWTKAHYKEQTTRYRKQQEADRLYTLTKGEQEDKEQNQAYAYGIGVMGAFIVLVSVTKLMKPSSNELYAVKSRKTSTSAASADSNAANDVASPANKQTHADSYILGEQDAEQNSSVVDVDELRRKWREERGVQWMEKMDVDGGRSSKSL